MTTFKTPPLQPAAVDRLCERRTVRASKNEFSLAQLHCSHLVPLAADGSCGERGNRWGGG